MPLKVNVTQSCLTLCDPLNCSLPSSSVDEILQARILEWVAIPFSRGSSQPRDETQVSCIAGRFLPTEPPGKPKNIGVGSLSLLHGIFSTQESNQGFLHCRQIFYQLSYQILSYSRDFHGNQNTGQEETLIWSFCGVEMFYVHLAMSHSHLTPQISLHVRKVAPTPRQQEVGTRMQPFAGFLFSQESHHQGEDSHPGRQTAYLRLNHRKEEWRLQANREAEGWTR